MARLARIVAPHIPHQIFQSGHSRKITFFREKEFQEYLDLLSEWFGRCECEVWPFCLMPRHWDEMIDTGRGGGKKVLKSVVIR